MAMGKMLDKRVNQELSQVVVVVSRKSKGPIPRLSLVLYLGTYGAKLRSGLSTYSVEYLPYCEYLGYLLIT